MFIVNTYIELDELKSTIKSTLMAVMVEISNCFFSTLCFKIIYGPKLELVCVLTKLSAYIVLNKALKNPIVKQLTGKHDWFNLLKN